MKTPIHPQLEKHLDRDLKMIASLGLETVVNDAVRRVFTAKGVGAVLVFPHSQPDTSYWVGVKHYGSGPTSRVRIRRSAVPTEVEDKPARLSRPKRSVRKAAEGAETLSAATTSTTLP
jgi:hypothetical protein